MRDERKSCPKAVIKSISEEPVSSYVGGMCVLIEPKELYNLCSIISTKQTIPILSRFVDNLLIYQTQPSSEEVLFYDIIDFVSGIVHVNEGLAL